MGSQGEVLGRRIPRETYLVRLGVARRVRNAGGRRYPTPTKIEGHRHPSETAEHFLEVDFRALSARPLGTLTPRCLLSARRTRRVALRGGRLDRTSTAANLGRAQISAPAARTAAYDHHLRRLRRALLSGRANICCHSVYTCTSAPALKRDDSETNPKILDACGEQFHTLFTPSALPRTCAFRRRAI